MRSLLYCGASFDYVIIKEKFDNGNLKSIGCLKSNYQTSSIEELFDFAKQDKMNIYPNPASQNININAESYINKIEIYSVSGELLKVYDNISSTNTRLELENLQTGAYIIKAYFDGFTYSKKFVKE